MKNENKAWHVYEKEKPEHGQWLFAIWGTPGSCEYGIARYFKGEADEDWCEMDGNECADPDYWALVPEPPKELNIYE